LISYSSSGNPIEMDKISWRKHLS